MADKQKAAAKTPAAGSADQKERDGKIMWISALQRGKRRQQIYINIILKKLQEHNELELHGLGEACAASIDLGRTAAETPFCTIKKYETLLTVTDNQSTLPKIIVTLKRTKKPTDADIPDIPSNKKKGDE